MPKLVEREREVAALLALVEAVPRGEGRAVLIEGPAGIGKSALLADARHRAAENGSLVLAGRGSELEREFPFGVVRQLFEGVVADPARAERALAGAAAPAAAVFGAPDAATDGDVSFAALHGLYWVALNLAAEQPLVLAIDDLHWCDRPSLRFVAYLARRLDGQPILVPATVRTAEPGTDATLLAEIAHEPSTVAIRPAALSAEAVRELVRERLGPEADETFCAACHSATGGNPLFLRQLLTALETDRVRPDAAHADVVLEIGPRAVSRTVIMRLARLSEDAIGVARAVAVLAESATLPTAAALTGLDEGRVADAIGALARAEILRGDLPLGFVHALVRDAVYQELPLGERELQHEQAARVLQEAGAPAEQVAAHLLAAPQRGQEWVAAVLREAGRAAVARGAAESGVAHLRRALAEPAPEAWRPALLLELGLAEGMVDGPAAVEHLTEAFERLEDPPARAVAAHALGRALLFTGYPAEGAALAERAVAELPEELEDDRRGLTAFALAAGYFGVGGPRTLRRFDAYRDPPPPDAGVGARMLAAPAALWWGYCGEGSAAECAALARAALHGGRLTAADNGLLSIPGIVTLALAEDGAADAAWEVAHVEAHRRGSLHAISSLHLWHGFALLLEGDLEAAEASLREAQDEFEDWGFGAVARMYTGAFLARALIDRGRRDEARAVLEAGSAMLDESDGGRYWRAVELELLVAEGRDEEAVSRSQTYARLHGHVVLPASAHWRSATARALDRLGRGDEAIALAEAELADARRWGAPGTVGPVLRVLGGLRRDTALLEQAADVLEGSRARLEHAKALADLGAALRHERRPSEAREPLRRALELADACSAAALVEHVRAELYATGARPRTAALGGVEALTASERRVAGFAAGGQSNRDIAQALFVTPKTVEVHLSNAYRKLGIRSRRELAGVLANTGDAA